MAEEKKSILDRLEENGQQREALDQAYWKASEQLTSEWEALMKELRDE